jgi:hypothetical protein
VYVGVVVRATSNGIIYVATQNGYELEEIHDVDLVTNPPASGDFLKYNGTLWVNDAINLGTDTVGNYMSDVSAGTGVTVTHTPGEGSTATVAIGQSVATSASPSFAGLNIDSGVLYVDAANNRVGINDTTPDHTLDIPEGTINIDNDVDETYYYYNRLTSDSISVVRYDKDQELPVSKVFIGYSGVSVQGYNGVLQGELQSTYLSFFTDTGNYIKISADNLSPADNREIYLPDASGTLALNGSIALGTDTTGNYMSGISGTSPVSVSHTPSEGSSATVSLDSAYGDTLNPYGSKTANYFLASPNGSAGAPSFRAIVAADIPTLNQNTTGTASNITASSNTTLTSLSNLATVGTLTAGSIPATLLTGTVASARISGSYTGITSVGTLSSLSSSGTISAQYYTASSNNYYVTGSTSSGGGINNGNLGYTGAQADSGMPWCTGPALGGRTGWAFYNQVYGDWRMGYRCNTGNSVRYLWCADYTILGSVPNDARATEPLVVVGDARATVNLWMGSYLIADDGVTGSGQAAQWISAFGNNYLVRNTSTLRDKENIAPIGNSLTAGMIDDIEIKLWSRKNSGGIPEVGPIAEEMEAVSPFLGIRGMDTDEDGNIVPTPVEGINQNSWLSLLTVALQEAREEIRTLNARLAVLESTQ